MIGLLATIKPNSLVFIDEPEISLHPNWQMKYLSFLRELFSEPEFATSHIILATHSNFIISDLRGENSKIIGLKKDVKNNNVIVDLPKNLNTYGWSAEEILYSVFNVKTTRNFYLEIELRELLHKIAIKSDDKKRMNDILNNIKKINFSDNDPINLIVKQAEKYLN